MNADDFVPGCFPCDRQAAIFLPPREDVAHTDHWPVAHVFNGALSRWLVLLRTSYVASFMELTPEAADELGGLVCLLGAALGGCHGCVTTYLMQFSEADGFSHLHLLRRQSGRSTATTPLRLDHRENRTGQRALPTGNNPTRGSSS